MMMLLLVACAGPPKDTGAEADIPVEVPGVEGCTYDAVYVGRGGVGTQTCNGGYDENGHWTGERCVDEEGLAAEWDYVYDDAGCELSGRWYLEFGDSTWEWTYGAVCDGYGNPEEGWDRDLEIAADGEVLEDTRTTFDVVNAYEDGDHVSAVRTYSDGGVWEERHTWDAAGLLEATRWRSDDDPWRLYTYAYDDAGRVTYTSYGDEGESPDTETHFTYDTLGRLVTQAIDRHGRGAEDYTRTHAYADDTARFVEQRTTYEDDSFAVETRAWTCP
ncbi:MAG: hypothetical protein ACK4YP_05835 [Myxococcota bacterium]